MKRSFKNQSGFSLVEVLLVLVILGAIAFAGYYLINNQDTTNDSNETAPKSSEQNIDEAQNNLNDIDLEDLDTTELDEAEADLL